jgi:hypothetical protein
MAKKRKASSLDTPACHLATTSPIALTAPQCSQREIATPDDDFGIYQFPSHQLELPVVDLMFPSLVLSDEDIESEEARMKQEEKVEKRKVASRKVKNWRANGKPWSALVKRLNWGILLPLPTGLLD